MKRNLSMLSIAAVAGAAALASTSMTKAAITLSESKVASGITSSAGTGTFDVWVVAVTGYTGLDATQGSTGQDAQILGLSGTLTDTAGDIAAIGKSSNYAGFTTTSANPQANGNGTTEPSNATTYFSFPNVTGTSITETGSATSSSGTASSLSGSWYTTPSGVTGNVGGVEAGKDPNGLVGSDPHAVYGQLAEILIPSGDTASFSGSAIDYGFPTGTPLTFTVGATGTGPTNPTTGPTHQPIIALSATAPTTYGSQLGTAISITGHNGSYSTGNTGLVAGQTTAFTAVSTFNPSTDPEVYALKLSSNGSSISTTNTTTISAIVADINNGNSSGGVVASPVTGVYTSLFPGYDVLLTAATGVGSTAYLGVDFSGDADTSTPGLTVTEIAAVPEPATMTGLVLGSAGLLLRRRKVAN